MTTHREDGVTAGHTPTPYYVYVGEDGEAIAIQKLVTGDNGGTTGKAIATMPIPSNTGHINSRLTRSEIDANAVFIVRAVNCHGEMLEALRSAESCLNDFAPNDDVCDALKEVRAAIAKATTP